MAEEKSYIEQARAELERIQKMAIEFGADTSKWSRDQVKQLTEAAENIDDLAGKAMLKGEKLYEELGIERRAKGAFIGAKIGLIGLKFAPFTSTAGAIFGALFPKYTADLVDSWREKHRAKQGHDTDHKPPSTNP
jgi:hypothetical protein